MNITQAKEQIKNAMRAYFTRDEFGGLRIPAEAQRPLFLMGPPGIGKTAVVSQVAEELGVGLLAYSMTHHTRQSTLGLPIISQKEYGGKPYSATEYTMSEIVASIYELMEESGVREGILFLDEINCVSETLMPVMLQFLQFKTFGKHAIPEGWLVVAAGNPPEFNRSVREFDVATWDRLKRVDIEADHAAWRSYAVAEGIHPAVLTYLDARKENFYRVRVHADGRQFVTARGWVDLARMIELYELHDIPVDELLIGQYLQDKEIAADFAWYYDLFHKYRADYHVEDILQGRPPENVVVRAREAAFDERLSLLGLLLDGVAGDIGRVLESAAALRELLIPLKAVKAGAPLAEKLEETRAAMEREQRRGALPESRRRQYQRILAFLTGEARKNADFAAVKADYDGEVAAMRAQASEAGQKLSALFSFCEAAWGEGQELLILVTELTERPGAAEFIARYGCEPYYRHNKNLMFHQRKLELQRQVEEFDAL